MSQIDQGKNMSQPETDKRNRFKKAIEFDERSVSDTNSGVLLAWPNPSEFPLIKDGGWEKNMDNIYPDTHSTIREWIFRRQSATLQIKIFVSSENQRAAIEQLFDIALNTMMVEPPYVRGPKELGIISMTYPKPGSPYLAWVFQNVCVQIAEIEDSMDITPLALHIQKMMAQSVVADIHRYLPNTKSINITKSTIMVGDTIKAEIGATPGTNVSTLRLSCENRNEFLDLFSFDSRKAELKAEMAGKGQIIFTLTDTSTLLCSSTTLNVEVMPSKQ